MLLAEYKLQLYLQLLFMAVITYYEIYPLMFIYLFIVCIVLSYDLWQWIKPPSRYLDYQLEHLKKFNILDISIEAFFILYIWYIYIMHTMNIFVLSDLIVTIAVLLMYIKYSQNLVLKLYKPYRQ